MSEDTVTHRLLLFDPDHWRSRAEEARTVAEQMSDPDARHMMLEIAMGYERLAFRVAARARN